jgi:hypothetical protein
LAVPVSFRESQFPARPRWLGEERGPEPVPKLSMSVAMLQSCLFYMAYGAVSLGLVGLCVWALLPSSTETLERVSE